MIQLNKHSVVEAERNAVLKTEGKRGGLKCEVWLKTVDDGGDVSERCGSGAVEGWLEVQKRWMR